MTATREAIVLPLLFLAVTLLGGFRLGTSVVLLAPPLVALVLGLLLVGVLARGGVLLPDLLVNGGRTPLENANGVVVLATLFSASAQVFNLLTPETGLLHLLFAVFFFMQLLTTMAGASGPRQLLRSVGVALGGAFVLRWVILENLYTPNTGTIKRMLTLLVEGASLGAIGYQPHAPVTGYVAFLAIALFLIGLWLLASAGQRSRGMTLARPTGAQLMLVVLAVVLAAACGRQDSHAPATVSEAKASANPTRTAADRNRAVRLRDEALRAARVWHPPAVPIDRVNFAENPQGTGAFRVEDDVTCRFLPKKVGGTSPKFNCELPGGDVVRVKYGTANPEIHAEVAASRLLAALGFAADRMYVVQRVRCLGCPAFPFQSLKCLDDTGLDNACFAGPIDYSHAADFDPAVIERRHDGAKIEAIEDQGWAWFELDRIDPAHGGSSRAEVDALRLMAVLLAVGRTRLDQSKAGRIAGGSGRAADHGRAVGALGQQGGKSAAHLPARRRARRRLVQEPARDRAGPRSHLRPAQGRSE
jgi:hypothetical protein